MTRNSLKSIFEAEGYDVLEATNGDEMHAALTDNEVNLVIMDINLPGKMASLLARELRERQPSLDVPDRRDNEVEQIDPGAGDFGADDHITKPFSPRELTIRARNLLNRTLRIEETTDANSDVEQYRFIKRRQISTVAA